MSDEIIYNETKRVDNVYCISKIVQVKHKLTILQGNAQITHVGGNGNFRFNLNRVNYRSEHLHGQVASIYESSGLYYDYSNLTFDMNITKEWDKLYNRTESKEYWREISNK